VSAVGPADVERVFREEYGRAVSVLVRLLGDIDLAEEAVQEAFVAAVQRWPATGLPPSPAGWIITTARNRAVDRFRRESSRAARQAEAAVLHAALEPTERGAVPDAAAVHLLPPRAVRQRPGRLDAAPAGRALDRGGR
jgi:RNA polymerase sigma-70 factor, ECF subfamily